jgi:hypothetical protein
MKKWLRRIRGAFLMGLTWGFGWLLIGGLWEGVLNVFSFPQGHVIDMWPQTLAIAGFLSGMAFSAVLGIAARRHKFGELSFRRFTMCGAVGGLLFGAFVLTTGGPVGTLARGLIIGILSLLGAVSGAGTLALARFAERRALLAASADIGELGLTEAEKRELLGGR